MASSVKIAATKRAELSAHPAAPPDAPTFCIVDPSLKDFVGHHFEYDRSTAEAAAALGYRPLILSHAEVIEEIVQSTPVRPTFSMDIWASPAGLQAQQSQNVSLACNEIFHRDLLAGLRNVRLGPETIVFGHMITERQLLGWAWFARKFVRAGGPKVILLLRYQAAFYHGDLCKKAFRMLERAARRGSLRLASDSARLAREIEHLTELPVAELPIPHTGGPVASEAAAQTMPRSSPLRLVSLGNARDEKGFLEILDAARALHDSPDRDSFEFILQANDAQPEVQAAIDAIGKLNLPHVKLMNEALSSADYYALLDSADVVLLPYWRSIYEARTSGIFVEAVAAGKPVICTDDTWMSDELARGGAATVCRDRVPADLVRAIRQMSRDYAPLHDRAQRTRAAYVAWHNAAHLVRNIADGVPQRCRPSAPPRVAVLYPWGDALAGKAGASLRLNLLVNFLEEHGAEVRVLQSGMESSKRSERVRIECYERETAMKQRLRDAFLRICRLFEKSDTGPNHLWWHIAPIFDPAFRYRVIELTRWADVVMLEYSYWGAVVEPACRSNGIRCILTALDIVSDQAESPIIRWLTRKLEFRAIARADLAVVVARDDQLRLARSGIKTTLIPNCVDVMELQTELPVDALQILDVLYEIRLHSAQVCLFVGSGFEPNRIAAQRIHEMAGQFAQRWPQSNALFVVVGGCATTERDGNFWALGKVDEFVLRALYKHTSLVLIPLPFGTGSSIKTVEALAVGKAILGTSVAFRGLNITSGIECVIEDKLEAYPDTINGLLKDAEKRTSIANAGRVLARDYDSRSVFKKYPPLLQIPLKEEVLGGQELVDRIQSETSISTFRQLCRRATEANHWEYGIAFAKQVLALAPDDAETNFLMGDLLAKREDPDSSALAFYDAAERNGYDLFAVRLARSRLLRKLDDTEGSEHQERLAIRAEVETARLDPALKKLRQRVWQIFNAREYDLVLKLCEGFQDTFPDRQHGDISYLLALSLHSLERDLPGALEHYDRALALGFDEFWVRFHRGRLLQELGEETRSEADLIRVAELKPNDEEVRRSLFSVRTAPLWRLYEAKKYEAVIEGARSLLETHDIGDLHYLLALSLHGLERDLPRALEHYDRALALGVDEFWVRFHRGRLLQELGEETRSEADLIRVAELKPDDEEVRRSL